MSGRFKVLFIYPNTEMATLVPINLSLLAPCLREAGFEVELFDTTYYKWEEINFEQKKVDLLQLRPFSYKEKGVDYRDTDMYEDLRKKVNDFSPDLIAITLVEDTFDLGISLLAAIRDYKAPVIAGGVFVTFSAEEVIANEDVDIVCIGEGEEALVELCEKMRRREDYSSVLNLWVKREGRIIKNPMRKLTDINALPYIDYDIFERKHLYRPMQGKIYTMIHVEIDRGCPYDCTYCEAPHLRKLFQEQGCGIYYRRKRIDRVIDEMKHLVRKYNPDYINFNAESFLARPLAELKEFAERYREIGLPFWCQSRPETVTEEKIKILKEMNCQNMQFGIEHGNEEFRSRMLNRHYTNKQMLEAFKIVEEYGIAYTVNNIIGFPDETRELVFDTIAVNRHINPATMNVYLFTPYKGTRLYQYCIEKGYLDRSDKVHQLLDGVPLKMDTISYHELKGLQRTFPLYAKMPEAMFKEIRVAERFDNEGNEMFNKLREKYYEMHFSQHRQTKEED
ncbi:B12-binding domain-containing radical SAM protein [Dissulfurispira sp.]|uniref:B12-binding domain-containing radical SAM protein n=1 Tax=Dissulfurispira sp. TaxID=2817609 RepID=UPI002FDB59EB